MNLTDPSDYLLYEMIHRRNLPSNIDYTTLRPSMNYNMYPDDVLLLGKIATNAKAILDAPDDLLNSKEFILKAIQRNSMVIRYIPESLKSDFDIAIEAVKIGGISAFLYLPFSLHRNRDFAVSLVKEVKTALPYFSPDIQEEVEAVLASE